MGFISNQWQKGLWCKKFGDLKGRPNWYWHLLFGPGAFGSTFFVNYLGF